MARTLSAGKYGKPAKKKTNVWTESKGRNNVLVSVRLQHKQTQQKFTVSNYHMPCVFWSQPVMIMHSTLAAQHVQRFAGSDPHIFCGDFNFKPHESPYELITTGGCSKPEDLPVADMFPGVVDPWVAELPHTMASAYAQHSAEPEFTNYATTVGFSPGSKGQVQPPFCETLDYIFLGPDIAVEDVLPIQTKDEVFGMCPSFPTDTEPSDHVMIAADLVLGATQESVASAGGKGKSASRPRSKSPELRRR
jgi:endonuclease/exonuclease/phosphatase family metal-dependent hydrolase